MRGIWSLTNRRSTCACGSCVHFALASCWAFDVPKLVHGGACCPAPAPRPPPPPPPGVAGRVIGNALLRQAARRLSSRPKSTSQAATMFCVIRLAVTCAPRPLTPTTAMLTRSLGGVTPWPPRTYRGTIITEAPVAAAVVAALRNFRRVTLAAVFGDGESWFAISAPWVARAVV